MNLLAPLLILSSFAGGGATSGGSGDSNTMCIERVRDGFDDGFRIEALQTFCAFTTEQAECIEYLLNNNSGMSASHAAHTCLNSAN